MISIFGIIDFKKNLKLLNWILLFNKGGGIQLFAISIIIQNKRIIITVNKNN